jgi:hypothetical protein
LRAASEAHITQSGVTVLGRYNPPPGFLFYIDKAQQRGASYFDIGDMWQIMTTAEREAANLHFLNIIGARGDKVILSVPRSQIIPDSALFKEVQYLKDSLNYQWVNQWSLQRR